MLKRLSILFFLFISTATYAGGEEIILQLLTSATGTTLVLPAKFNSGLITLRGYEVPAAFRNKMAVLNVAGSNTTAVKLYVWKMEGFSAKFSIPTTNALYNNAFTLVYDGKDPLATLTLQLVNELTTPNPIYVKVNYMNL